MQDQHYLTSLFAPTSVAVVGASEREDSPGAIIFKNIVDAGYSGRLHAVNPRHKTILGMPSVKSVEEIGERVQLAILATRPASMPEIVTQCARAGVRNVVIIRNFAEAGEAGPALWRKTQEIARHHDIRILGPDCLGIVRPASRFHAAFVRTPVAAGNLALVSQSGSMCAALLDWAAAKQIGFSCVAALGEGADIDLGEILDFLVSDNRTHHILLYVENIANARHFLSALRSAARIKPIILLKAGRRGASTGVDAADDNSDAAFDAAVRRAGIVRVRDVGQLFHAAKALAAKFCPLGRRLAIVANGRGPAIMAADHAAERGIVLAPLAPATLKALHGILPPTWSQGNPVDIVGDATPARYRETILAVAQDENVDSLLVILAPQALSRPLEIAEAVKAVAKEIAKPITACWMGEAQVAEARRRLEEAGIPAFAMPETAVDLHCHISAYYHNQKLLLQTPATVSPYSRQEAEGARLLIDAILQEPRKTLSEMESKAVLRAFGIPVAQTVVARTPTEALLLAEQIGFPVAMKIDSPDIARKTEAGGVRLNIVGAPAVRSAYLDIQQTIRHKFPQARINGVSIEPYISRPNGRELRIVVTHDAIFGPVIGFGSGGQAVEIFRDRAVALPPLNRFLAHDLIASTRAAELLGEFRGMPAIHLAALENVLLKVSEMVCELPWLRELDLDPLLVDENGAIAIDARIVIDAVAPDAEQYAHMAIHPYPAHLVEEWVQADGQVVTLRPIRPEDAELEQDFIKQLSEETRYYRFMDTLRELTQTMLVRFTQIDYDREMALVATVPGEKGKERLIGVSRYIANPDGETVEFALVVADEWQKHGIGRKLMNFLIDIARRKGYRNMMGEVLTLNTKMFRLTNNLGFTIHPHPDDAGVKRVIRSLQD